MELEKTTLRINRNLKKQAHKLATKQNTTLQHIFNQALLYYMNTLHDEKRQEEPFRIKTFNIGVKDLPRRSELYGDYLDSKVTT